MITEEQVYQSIALLFAVAVFDFLERIIPGFPVNKRRELLINLIALIVVVVAGELWKKLIFQGFNAVDLGRALSMSALSRLPGTVKILAAVVLSDFSLYWVHRAMHSPVLWRTHAFHHSIKEIWWLAGSRTSLTHLFLFAVPQIFIGYYLLLLTVPEAGAAYSFAVIVNIWLHTNIWVDLGPVEWLIITPNFHRIHHGGRGNLGFVFTLWDRIFGTYEDPKSLGKDFVISSVPTDKRLIRLLVGI